MSFSVNRVEYINNKNYDERVFALALASGVPNFVVDGLDLDFPNRTITNGRGINLGSIFTLGLNGESEVINDATSDEYYIVLETLINGDSSTTTIIQSNTFLGAVNSTANLKYFTIYKVDKLNDVIVQDYRHINYVKDLFFKDLGDDTFSLVLNGFESQPFNTSVLQNAYTKSESNERFGNKFIVFDLDVPVGIGDSVDLSSDIPNNSNLYDLGYSRIICQNTLVSDQPDVILPISKYSTAQIRWNVSTVNRTESTSSTLATTAYRIDYLPNSSELKFVNIYSQLSQLTSPFIVENSELYFLNRIILDNGKGLEST